MHDQNIVSIYGYGHISGLEPLLKNSKTYPLYIDTTHIGCLFNTSPRYYGPADPVPASFTPLSTDVKEAAEQGNKVYAMLPGKGVSTAKDALEMAQKADQARGTICEKQMGNWADKVQSGNGRSR